MNALVTNHVAEIAVPGQAEIIIRAARGEVELGQQYDGEWHGIYVQPQHVLRLIRAMLLMIGMDDVKLYRGGDGQFALCEDVDWPDNQFARDFDASKASHEADPPKDRTATERQRRHRSKKRDIDRDTNRDGDRDSVTGQEQLRLVAAPFEKEVLHAAD
jgi:hypothetical protein